MYPVAIITAQAVMYTACFFTDAVCNLLQCHADISVAGQVENAIAQRFEPTERHYDYLALQPQLL